MADPYVAEIRIFACNFAPYGWAFCDGQLLPISQNTALFSLLGTTYGGDGKSNFALPDLEGRVPLHVGGNGPGAGLYDHFLGEQDGVSNVTLIQSEMPSHQHTLQALNLPGRVNAPGPAYFMGRSSGALAYQSNTATSVFLSVQSIGVAGSSLPHNNMMPYLVLNFCIAMQGFFPPR
jgi:microcystin-dependent protein